MKNVTLTVPKDGVILTSGRPVTNKPRTSVGFPLVFDEVRRDLVRLVNPVEVTEVAMHKAGSIYSGILNTTNGFYLFALSSKGLKLEKTTDSASTREAFEAMRDFEMNASRRQRREDSAREYRGRFAKSLKRLVRAVEAGDFTKALPKPKAEAPPKKAKKPAAAQSKTGTSSGKTRYNYAGEKTGAKKPAQKQGGDAQQKKPTPSGYQEMPDEMNHQQSPLVVPRTPQIDPNALAQQMKIDPVVLRGIAKRFRDNPRLNGREGFVRFMQYQLKAFAEKHKLDADYFKMLYESLLKTPVPSAPKQA